MAASSGLSVIPGYPGDELVISAHGPIYNGPGAERPDRPFALRKLEHHQKEAVERAKKYAMEQSVKLALMKQTQSQQNLQANAAKRNQTLTLLNRIYIGSIAYDIKEEMIKQYFLPFGPIKSVSMSWDPITQKHKGFAFVEYEFPEAAQLAIEQMNGTNFGGRLLKVGRPSNLPDAAPFVVELIEEYQLQKRIYVAGVHLDLTEVDLSLVFEAFGKIVMCRLAQDPARPNFHRGFGYVEFDSEQAANAAVMSMNRFDLGGQLLRVIKAISPPDGITINTVTNLPPAAAVAAASVTAKLLSLDAEQLPMTMSAVPQIQHRSPSPGPVEIHHYHYRHLSSPDNHYHHYDHHHDEEQPFLSQQLIPTTTDELSVMKNVTQHNSTFNSFVPESPIPSFESYHASEQHVAPSGAGKWAQFSMEEEQFEQPAFVRSNDSRLYSIPSPSSIPLPPPP